MERHTIDIATAVVEALRIRGMSLATAESCTGGAVSAAITEVAGCSDTMLGAVVAYSNSVKSKVLGVKENTLEQHGAVSEETVKEMACGVAKLLGSDCAIATSGIAGPGGGTAEKPVGTVWVAIKIKDCITTELLCLNDKGREKNIATTVTESLKLILGALCKEE